MKKASLGGIIYVVHSTVPLILPSPKRLFSILKAYKIGQMKYVLTLIAITACLSGWSQSGADYCIKSRIHHHDALKTTSASLTTAQIARTEKYDVHYYFLDLEMDNLSTDLEGTGEIHGTAREALDSVLFELYNTFTISQIRLNGAPIAYSRNGSAITVPVNLVTGDGFAIAIDYDGTPPSGGSNPFNGGGMSNGTSGSWGNQVTWSLSEPFSAYEWFPVKQSLRDKVDSSTVFITVPTNLMAGSNGSLDTIVDLGNGTHRFEWTHHHVIDYYLISVAIAEYVEYNVYAHPTGLADSILIQNFIYNNPATLPFFENDIDETADFMELFCDLYGMYPYADEKYGHCMAPFGGGMEHQTMTTQGFFNRGLTAHELGHQWWGNNVTCASWADIWVNEGFASYSAYLMLEYLYPGDEVGDMQGTHNNIMNQNGGSVWAVDSLNVNRIFSGRLSYDKGSAIIHTFRFIMNNDSLFFQTLKDIQTNMGDGTAIGLDIRDAFATASGIDYTDAFNEWYFGEGYPSYSLRWNEDGGDLYMVLSHTTSSSTPTFTNPLEIRIPRVGADTTIRVDVSSNSEFYIIPNIGNVLNIPVSAIDPNNWIINAIGNVSNDLTLVGIEDDLPNTPEYTVYPNPSNGLFRVEAALAGEQSYQLFDVRGRLIHSGDFDQQLELDITDSKAGPYILYLQDAIGNRVAKTLIKE